MLQYFIVDAFTNEPFGGNPAGVVLLNGELPSERLMQQVAAELRYSETVFVQQQDDNEFTLRYFTPCSEVELCGHATIAAFGVLLKRGILRDNEPIVNHTLAGDLMIIVNRQVMMQMAAPVALETPLDTDHLHRIMAVSATTKWPDLPVEIISTGLPDIIMPVKDVETLNELQPNMDELSRISKELKVVGVHAFASSNDGYTAHVRNFAPLYGIPEESATGTANAALTHYLHRHGQLVPGNECLFMQGETMGRPSLVCTELHHDGCIWVGGDSCIVAEGVLMV